MFKYSDRSPLTLILKLVLGKRIRTYFYTLRGHCKDVT